MEVLPGHAAVRMQPVLGVAPKSLDAVDMVASDRLAFPLADHHVLATQLQRAEGYVPAR